MNLKVKLISGALLLALLGTGALSYAHAREMAGDTHHVGDCPLVPGEQRACATAPVEHVNLWQRGMTALPQGFLGLLAFLSFLGAASLAYRFLFDTYPRLSRAFSRAFEANLPVDPYVRLFSDGILHPKVP